MRITRKIIAGIMCVVLSAPVVTGHNPNVIYAAGNFTNGIAVEDVNAFGEGDDVIRCQNAVDTAQSNVDTLKKQLEEYKAEAVTKETVVTEAVAVVSLGSYGYFKSKNSTDAMNILTGTNVKSSYIRSTTAPDGFIGYTNIGQEGDATSLENMKLTLDWIKECNKIRVNEGLNPCTVNDVAMAMAQTDANYSANKWGHASYYNVAENLAKGYAVKYGSTGMFPDPYVGWYTEEKTIYRNNVGNYDGASSMSAYQLSQSYPDFYHQVGHYLNIIVSGTPVTGYAVNSSVKVHAQEFDSYGRTGTGVDVDSYEKDFMAYYNKVTAAVTKAQSDLAEINNKISSTEIELATANNTLSAAKTALENAKKAEADAAKKAADAKQAGADALNEITYTDVKGGADNAIVTIPAVITRDDGVTYQVTKIADNAFKNNSKIKIVTIDDNIKEIGTSAFQNVAKLTTVKSGTSLAIIGNAAFKGDKALKTADFSNSSIMTIGKNAFKGDKKLKSIKINGNKLKKVGKNAFKGIKKNALITIYAKNRKIYNKAVKLIKKSGVKNVRYKYKKKKR